MKWKLVVLAGYLLVMFSTPATCASCPEEDETICIECHCDHKTGFSNCRPEGDCPGPTLHAKQIMQKQKKEICPHRTVFHAQCSLCECSGDGLDTCALCIALPVRRGDQPTTVNQLLPKPMDNRLFNYEIHGWDPKRD